MLGLDFHPLRQWRDAGAGISSAVDHHHAVGAFSDGAENSAGFMMFYGIPMDHNSGAVKSSRYGLALATGHIFAVECKFDLAALLNFSQYWVFRNSQCLLPPPFIERLANFIHIGKHSTPTI
jgi:hypothetical protein